MKCETCEKLARAVERMLDRLPYRNDGVERATREVREMIAADIEQPVRRTTMLKIIGPVETPFLNALVSRGELPCPPGFQLIDGKVKAIPLDANVAALVDRKENKLCQQD